MTTRSWANIEVIELLERFTQLAREVPFSHVSIAVCGHGGKSGAVAAFDTAGDVQLEKGALETLDALADQIAKSHSNRQLPEKDPALDQSYVCYDTAGGPLNYDFLVWLIDQEMTRIRSHAPGPLKVGFWQGAGGEICRGERRAQWINNVFRPALKFIGAVEDDRALRGRSSNVYVSRNIVAAAKAGEWVPVFKPQRSYSLPRGAVTITLREAAFWSKRNSNIDAWLGLARKLRDEGERVIFVRDTEKCFEPLEDFETCPQASIDVNSRLELYEDAKVNLFKSNGPATLGVFGTRPYLQFVELEPDGSEFGPNTPHFWKANMGVTPGEQYPWSRDGQRLVFAADTYENIEEAWTTNKKHFVT